MKGIDAHRWTGWLFLAVLLCVTGFSARADMPAGIHVSGRGTLEVEPDMGYVQLQARKEGMDAGTLKRDLDKIVRDVLTLAKRLGIAERDVTATAVSINPRYQRRDDEMVVSGLTASRSIQVTLRDLDRFGDLLNGALDLGINNLDPIRLGVKLVVLFCQAPDAVLDERVSGRATAGGDPSEATPAVLALQRSRFEPPGEDEPVVAVDTSAPLDDHVLEALAARVLAP